MSGLSFGVRIWGMTSWQINVMYTPENYQSNNNHFHEFSIAMFVYWRVYYIHMHNTKTHQEIGETRGSQKCSLTNSPGFPPYLRTEVRRFPRCFLPIFFWR